MAVFHQHIVSCMCGNDVTVDLADSLNIKRSPAVRDLILKGELHRASCPACGLTFTVEKPFYYTDLTRSTFIKVMPRDERHTWKLASEQLQQAARILRLRLLLLS